MFGYRNFTGVTFFGKVGKITLEFSVGFIEEIALNLTIPAAAHAADIQENFNLDVHAKDKMIRTAAVGIGSKLVKSNLAGLIAGATPNLLI